MPLPSFLIVGAQKCGTSTLHRLAAGHPQVFMSVPKELHFFDKRWERGVEWYAEQFTPSWRHRQLGETTPYYMYDERARSRLVETLPHARIVAILRNPIDRAYSHYWHDRRVLPDTPSTFEDALTAERNGPFAARASTRGEQATAARKRHHDSYVDRGHYVDQLEPFGTAYGRSRVHVILLEDLVHDRIGCLRELFTFLEVRVGPARRSKDRQANPYRERDDSRGNRQVSYPPMAPETRARLAAYYDPFNQRLSAWMGRDLSHWR
ncbi:MAG: sulfotransferase family protein [Actinomycetes bacterium]